MAGTLIFLFLLACFLYVLIAMNPKLDWNYETEERILWFNDPFNYGLRKSIVLYKKSK